MDGLMESQIKIVKKTKNIACITFNGRLDALCRDQVKDTLLSALGTPSSAVVVDLKNVPFIDSSGLAALVSGLKTLGGEAANLKLAAPQSQARLLFELTMFDRVFEIHDSVDDALNSLNQA